MKKFVLCILMISNFFVLSDIIVHGEQKAGKGGYSVFGKSQDGSINNNDYKNNKSTNVNTSASVLKK